MAKKPMRPHVRALSILTGCGWILATSTMLAQAESHLTSTPELSGVNQVFKLISNVNLTQMDTSFRQSAQGILEFKNQLYTQNDLNHFPNASTTQAAISKMTVRARMLPPTRPSGSF